MHEWVTVGGVGYCGWSGGVGWSGGCGAQLWSSLVVINEQDRSFIPGIRRRHRGAKSHPPTPSDPIRPHHTPLHHCSSSLKHYQHQQPQLWQTKVAPNKLHNIISDTMWYLKIWNQSNRPVCHLRIDFSALSPPTPPSFPLPHITASPHTHQTRSKVQIVIFSDGYVHVEQGLQTQRS